MTTHPNAPLKSLLLRALFAAALGWILGSLVGHLLGGYALARFFEMLGALAGFGYRLIPALQQLPSVGAASPPPAAAPEPEIPSAVADQFERLGVPTAVPAAATSAPAHGQTGWQDAPVVADTGPGWFARATDFALDWFRRGNPMARVGVVILFFGGAFLAKYAVELNLFPLELRLAALAAGAIVLLGLGWRLRARRRQYALILQGGGIAVLYLTVYTSLRLYQLIPQGMALPLMIVVALASAVLAVAQNALVLAVIGFAGGFAAPILASTGGGDHVALFSYYTVLNLGVFAIAWYRAWRVLNLVGFAFTFGITALWRGTRYTEADLATTGFFLLLFFLLYVGVSILFALRQPPKLKGYVSGSLVFGLPVIVFGLLASLVRGIEYGLAWSAFGIGLFYVGLAWTLFLTRQANLRLLAEAFAALGVIFGSLAVPLAFDPEATSAIWAVEGAGLLWLGLRQNRKLARAFGVLLQLGAGAHYLSALGSFTTEPLLFNGACMGALGLAAAGFLSALWLQRGRDALAEYERPGEWVFLLWSLGWWLYAGFDELDRAVPTTLQYGFALTFLAGSAALLHGCARALRWRLPDQSALALSSLTLTFMALAQFSIENPAANGGVFGWPILLVTYWGLLYRAERGDAAVSAPALAWLHAQVLWVLALIAARELSWQIAHPLAGVWPDLAWGVVLAVLLGWVARGPGLWPLSRHRSSYRLQGATPLAVVLWLWILAINLGSRGDPAPLPYLPLLNPLDLTVMLAGLALGSWWFALAEPERAILQRVGPRLLVALVAASVFLWLNAALVRALHYGMATPLFSEGALQSFVVQAALSILWSVLGFAAMILATRRGLREVWLAGAALMAVVVAKLFLVDLSGSGTLARIVSFLSVGALLLVTGYFSPLPPKMPTGKPAAVERKEAVA